ncbi:MAG: hypothetical protein BRD50_03160 [Bacteroidetes bacterium SW_11_45_7]|nr:MAG: hypothetical protein BRD50_03160 [Bacteroidetes bacterium SW_11_45_7]
MLFLRLLLELSRNFIRELSKSTTMYKVKSILLVFICLFSWQISFAQMDMPKPSPKAEVKQRVGLTDIEIEYYSPGVKGRQIWGQLVPYDKMWRTGANAATTIEFSKDVKVNGNEMKAGKYSFFTIPGKDEWTLIFNEETELWGTGNYDKDKDVLRIKAEPRDSDFEERMAFNFRNFDYEKTRVDLEWKETRVSFNVNVHTDKQVLSNIDQEISSIPDMYADVARYTLRVDKHYDKGLKWVNKSINQEEGWYNHWIKAEILKKKEKDNKAYKHLKKSKKLGEQAENFFYREEVNRKLDEWQ